MIFFNYFYKRIPDKYLNLLILKFYELLKKIKLKYNNTLILIFFFFFIYSHKYFILFCYNY